YIKNINKKNIHNKISKIDYLFKKIEILKDKKIIEDIYNFMKNKKVILYAPTFRDNSNNDIMIDYEKLKASISDDYVLLIKRHPRLNTTFKADVLPDFLYDVSAHQNINELLTAV